MKKLSEYIERGDLLEIKEFKQSCIDGGFIDYDGFGYLVFHDQVDETRPLSPSEIKTIPASATHILWFNR